MVEHSKKPINEADSPEFELEEKPHIEKNINIFKKNTGSIFDDLDSELLVPKLDYLEDVLKGRKLDDLAQATKINLPRRFSKYFIEFPDFEKEKRFNTPNKEGKFERANLYTITDTHGASYENEEAHKRLIADLANGKESFLQDLGDDCNALFLKKDGKLNIKQDGTPMEAYEDNSLQIIVNKIALMEKFGDRFVNLIGNEQLPLIFPDFKISKDGYNLSEKITKNLSDKEKAWLSNAIRKYYSLMTATHNGVISFHSGTHIPSLKSFKELDKIVFDKNKKQEITERKFELPPGKEEMTYGEQILKWYNETLLGGITYGITKKSDKTHKEMVYYSEKATEEWLNSLSKELGYELKKIFCGHRGLGPFIYVTNGEENERDEYEGGLSEHFDRGKRIILLTTEGKRARDIRVNGKNNYGHIYHLDLSKKLEYLNYANFEKSWHKHKLEGVNKKIQEIKNTLTENELKSNQELIETLVNNVKTVVNRRGFDYELGKRFVENKKAILEDIISQRIERSELLKINALFEQSTAKNITDLKISKKTYLEPIKNTSEKMIKYFIKQL